MEFVTPPIKHSKKRKNGEQRKPYSMANRRARTVLQKTPTKKIKLVDRDLILETLQSGCCLKNCLLHHFSVDSILEMRKRYSTKNEAERTDMLQRMCEGALRRNLAGVPFFEWHLNSHRVCEQCVVKVLGCSKTKLYNAKVSLTNEGVTHGRTGQKQKVDLWDVDWYFEMNYFLENLIKKLGDQMLTDNSTYALLYNNARYV